MTFYYVCTHDKEPPGDFHIRTFFDLEELAREVEKENWTDEDENIEPFEHTIKAREILTEIEYEGAFLRDGDTFMVAVVRASVCPLCEKLGNTKPGSTCSMCGRTR